MYDREIGVWSPVNVMWVEIPRGLMDGKHSGRWLWVGFAVRGKAAWALQEVGSAESAGLGGAGGSAVAGMDSVQSCRNHQSRRIRRSRHDLGEEIRNHQSRQTRHAACRSREQQRHP